MRGPRIKTDSRAPIACTLQPGDYRERLAWIAELARDGLLGVSRDDHRLELRYAQHVIDRVREMVGKEQSCCAFLDFKLAETDAGIRLAITGTGTSTARGRCALRAIVPPGVSATGKIASR